MKMLDILTLHNYFRAELSLDPLIFSQLLSNYAKKSAKWMARRRFNNFWNFDYVRLQLTRDSLFQDVDYNIAIGQDEQVVMRHLLNNYEKKQRIFANFTYLGYDYYETDWKYWCILYSR